MVYKLRRILSNPWLLDSVLSLAFEPETRIFMFLAVCIPVVYIYISKSISNTYTYI